MMARNVVGWKLFGLERKPGIHLVSCEFPKIMRHLNRSNPIRCFLHCDLTYLVVTLFPWKNNWSLGSRSFTGHKQIDNL